MLLGARAAGPSHWRVAVWDTGPGIPADQHDTIFGEFVRGAGPVAADESVTGLGLGLAIVQRSAALLGTPVALRSQLGRGSCFSVLLPRANAAKPAPAEAPPRTLHFKPLGGRRVWLLEDNAHARGSMSLLLQHWGAQVQAFASLSALRLEHTSASGLTVGPAPDLFLTDLRLPDGQGTAALLLLRSSWPGLPSLIVTGNTAPEELIALEGWRDSGVQVLVKPFSTHALQAAVLAALAGAQQH
jgi:CheY-like chemotaxis protein